MEKEKQQNDSVVDEVNPISDSEMNSFFLDGVESNVHRLGDCLKSELIDIEQIIRLHDILQIYCDLYGWHLKQKKGI